MRDARTRPIVVGIPGRAPLILQDMLHTPFGGTVGCRDEVPDSLICFHLDLCGSSSPLKQEAVNQSLTLWVWLVGQLCQYHPLNCTKNSKYVSIVQYDCAQCNI